MKLLTKVFFLLLLFVNVTPLNAQWVQLGNDIDGEAAGDQSGWAVSLSSDGSIVAIGGRENGGTGPYAGHARVFKWDGSSWIQVGNDIDAEAEWDHFGESVSLSADGNTIAVGGPNNDDNGSSSGHVRVFEFDGSNWIQLGTDIDGEDDTDWSGRSVDLNANGTIVAIGAEGNDDGGSQSGHVRVFEYNGINWVQLGNDIDGEATGDASGQPVSINANGNIVAIGSRTNDGNGTDAGHIRVFEFDGNSWIQLGMDIDGEYAGDLFGSSICLNDSGNIVAAGAIKNDAFGTEVGHVRVFEFNGSSWIQLGTDIDGESNDDKSGHSVSLSSDGSIIAIGALLNDGNDTTNTFRGHIRIFEYNGSNWIQIGNDIDGEATNDMFGRSVNLSSDGSIVAAGSSSNDGNGISAGHVRIFNSNTTGSCNYKTCSKKIYPNPTSNIFSISNVDFDMIEIWNNLGQNILETNQNVIDISGQPSGIYIIKIISKKETITEKIIKK